MIRLSATKELFTETLVNPVLNGLKTSNAPGKFTYFHTCVRLRKRMHSSTTVSQRVYSDNIDGRSYRKRSNEPPSLLDSFRELSLQN